MTLRVLLSLPIVGGALLLSACATPHGGTTAAGGEQHMDMSRMCAMHRQMTAGRSAAEQQAAIEAHVKSMHGSADPQMVARHRQMMERHCTGGEREAPRTY